MAIVAVPVPAMAAQPEPLPEPDTYMGCGNYYVTEDNLDAALTNSGTEVDTANGYAYELTDEGLEFTGGGTDGVGRNKARVMLPYNGTLDNVAGAPATIDYTYTAADAVETDGPPIIAFANGTVGGMDPGDLYSELIYGPYYDGPTELGTNDSGLASIGVGGSGNTGGLTYGAVWNGSIDPSLVPTAWATSTSPIGTPGGSLEDWATEQGDQDVATVGLVMDSATGSFTVHSFTVGCTTYNFGPYPATLTPSTLAVTGQSGVAIDDVSMATDGGVAGARSFTADGLPEGLVIDPGTGTISGTPVAPGTASATVTATDVLGNEAKATITFNITPGPLSVSLSQPSTSGTVGAALSVTAAGNGGTPPYVYSATGLPDGVSIDPASGIISGTPTTAGSGTATITVTDDTGEVATVDWAYTIAAAPVPTTPTTPPPAPTSPSTPMPQQLSDTGANTTMPAILAGLFIMIGAGIMVARRRALG